MASRGTRCFYPRQNRSDQVRSRNQDNLEQNLQQELPFQPIGSANRDLICARGYRGRGRGQTNRPVETRKVQETLTKDVRNDWPQLCQRHLILRKHFPDLPCFEITEDIYDAVMAKSIQRLPHLRNLNRKLNPKDYVLSQKQLLECEEVHQAIEMRKFDMVNKLVDIKNSCIDFPGLSNGQPSLVTGDIALIHNHNFTIKELFHIVTTRGDKIVLSERKVAKNMDLLKKPQNITFVSSGIPFDACRRALDKSTEDFIQNMISEKWSFELAQTILNSTLKIDVSRQNYKELDDRLALLNHPQRQAVLAIIEARCRPRPYILFGPPGTGKTHTLVEACVQIYKRDNVARILLSVNSNTCADQICEKLERTGLIDINGLERIRAGDRVSGLNFRRIIVTTNIKSGSLMSQHSKFDYVFLDEAGHAHEPESLIPICSLDERNGFMVLAGDPKQLGPVVQCQQANDLGLGTSMLERMFKFEEYKKQQANGMYNKLFITKLLHCYRCDPDILELPNKLFYDNELLYVTQTPRSLLRILNIKKSVQFRHVNGTENKPEWSTSWRNFQEVEACVGIIMRLYKMGLDAEQIGLIPPYKLQSKEIVKRLKSVISGNSRLLNARFPSKTSKRVERYATDDLAQDLQRLYLDWSSVRESVEAEKAKPKDYKIIWNEFQRDWLCKIDTVDAFQGNEREVIIISTVRTGSNRRSTDFLNDARRFNVAVSRAKWLVIVVGDKNIISSGNYWSKFYELAKKNDINQWPHIPPGSEDPHTNATPIFKRRDDT